MAGPTLVDILGNTLRFQKLVTLVTFGFAGFADLVAFNFKLIINFK
jgi:hypothetical protein